MSNQQDPGRLTNDAYSEYPSSNPTHSSHSNNTNGSNGGSGTSRARDTTPSNRNPSSSSSGGDKGNPPSSQQPQPQTQSQQTTQQQQQSQKIEEMKEKKNRNKSETEILLSKVHSLWRSIASSTVIVSFAARDSLKKAQASNPNSNSPNDPSTNTTRPAIPSLVPKFKDIIHKRKELNTLLSSMECTLRGQKEQVSALNLLCKSGNCIPPLIPPSSSSSLPVPSEGFTDISNGDMVPDFGIENNTHINGENDVDIGDGVMSMGKRSREDAVDQVDATYGVEGEIMEPNAKKSRM